MVYRLGYMKKSGNRLSRCPDFVLNYNCPTFWSQYTLTSGSPEGLYSTPPSLCSIIDGCYQKEYLIPSIPSASVLK
ncbi:hypothetical protein D1Z86_28070 [Escherichia coli]|nr:hypothetical protein [Escherichia coli]MIA41713.1 hypothetical protein [Escherichia coli]